MEISNAHFFNILIVVFIFGSLIVRPSISCYFFESHNLRIMSDYKDPFMKEEIRNNITKTCNFTELFEWEHKYLKWVDIGELSNRTTNPLEILASSKGHCGEFALLYLAACLSLGYEARLLASVRPYTYSGLHNWVEVKIDNSWVHVDPTESKWNQPSMYREGDWWGVIGKDALVYAFEEGKVQDVTNRYR